ncbi:hypothetical protein V5799_006625 [Amblyomma americanum]|uniref:BESS domain-containing protein n=1 Tax=Amblyomma americanum TaxID=6943 RepID=A0AAQ4DVV6_AMBAM
MMMFLKDQVDIGSTFSNSHAQDGETADSVLESIYSETEDGAEPPEDGAFSPLVPSRSTSPEPHTRNGSSQASTAARTLAAPRSGTGKKRKERSRWQDDIEKVDALITEDKDQASVYGQLVAHKLRACPKHAKRDMEMDLLQFIAKYTFHDNPE